MSVPQEFFCRLALPTGEIVERVVSAESEAALRHELEEKDCLVLDLRRRNALLAAASKFLSVRPRINPREFLFFNQEFSALIRAGLPILSSLDILIERRKNPAFRRALVDIRDRVKSGESLSEAFGAQGDLFPRLYSSSLASGERSGELPSVLKRYVSYTRSIMAIKKKVVSAAIYPAAVISMALVVVGIMTFYVIPRFRPFLTEMGVDLPWYTQALLTFASFVSDRGAIVGAAVLAGIVALFAWQRTEAGRLASSRFSLRIPLVGEIIHDFAQNRFTRTLSTLIAGGIPLVTSLELAARAVGNLYMERRLYDVTRSVREGQPLWESLERTRLISDITIEMVKVGESTGALSEMLDSSSEFSEEEIDFKLNRLVTLVEPLMLVVIAVFVAGVLLSFYMPLIRAAGGSRF